MPQKFDPFKSRGLVGRTISKMVVAVVYVAAFGAAASPGSLDPSFGSGGGVTTIFAGSDAIINGLTLSRRGTCSKARPRLA